MISDWLASHLSPDETLRRGDQRRLTRDVERGLRSIGVAAHPAAEPPELVLEFQYQQLLRALDGAARRLAGVPHREHVPMVEVSDNGVSSMVPKLDVNTASATELADLPGLGPVSAERVVRARSTAPFTTLEAVEDAAEVSTTAFAKAAPRLTIAASPLPSLPTVLTQIDADGAKALIDAIIDGDLTLAEIEVEVTVDDAPRSSLVAEVCGLLIDELVATSMFPPDHYRLMADLAHLADAAALVEPSPGTPAGFARPVYESDYLETATELISSATTRCWVAVFFLSWAGDGPLTPLIEALVAAAARGVDVRVLVDNDLPGDYHGARNVNEAALAGVMGPSVPIRSYYVERPLHAKVVITDNDALVGSHNWTIPSMYHYVEETALVTMEAVTDALVTWFDDIWRALDPVTPAVSLRSLDTPSAADLAALADAGVPDDTSITRILSTPAARADTTSISGLDGDEIDRLYQCCLLMEELGIGETAALALAAAGLTTPDAVAAASLESLTNAFSDLSGLPAPHHTRRLPTGFASHIQELA